MRLSNRSSQKLAGMVLAAALVSGVPASATGWIIEAQLIGVEDNGPFGVEECVLPNRDLRVRSRWISTSGPEWPWGVWWGSPANIVVTTDANGEFSQGKYMLNLDLARDIEIQKREPVWPNAWYTIAIIENVNGMAPDFTAGWDDRGFDLGEIRIPSNCEGDLFPADDDDRGGKGDKGKKKDGNSFFDREPVAQAMPCGSDAFGGPGVDLVFGSVTVRHRDNAPNAAPEQVTWEVVVRNQGTASYKGTESCLAEASVTFTRTDPNDGGTDERTYCTTSGDCDVQGPLAPGASAIVTEDGNLWQSTGGADQVDVLFEVDPDGQIWESDKANNTAIGCYEPATETFQLGPCQ